MNILNKQTKINLLVLGGALLLPKIVFAQTIQDVFRAFLDILAGAFPVIIGLSLLYFLWGLSQYMLKTDDVEGRKGARDTMFWGVIILFVMVSIWGLVNFLGSVFVFVNTPPLTPQLFEVP